MVRPLNALIVSSTKPEFVERVGVDHHLHVVFVGDPQAAVDRRGRRAPVLMQLERTGTGLDHFFQRRRARGIALAGKSEIDRKRVRRLDHARKMKRPGRASGGVGAGGRSGAAAEHRGDAGHQRLIHLLRTNEMDVRVEAAGGEDLALAGDHLGAGADDNGDAGLDVRIAGFADRRDAAVLEADVGFDNAPVVEDQRVGDDGVDRTLGVGNLRLAHAVADHLAAAKFHFLAVDGEILLHLDDQIGVGKPHAVAGGRPEHVRIGRAFHDYWHRVVPTVHRPKISALASRAGVDRLTSRSAIFGSRRTGMAAMTGAGMGRGCCLQYSWSMFAGPGSQLLGTVLRAHACGPEMDPRACDGWTTVRPLWLLGVGSKAALIISPSRPDGTRRSCVFPRARQG